jgi:HSP20 family protein
MTLVRFSDPFSDITRLFDDFLVPAKSTFDRDFFHPQIFNRSTPSVEVYETDDSHVIEVAAPGLDRDKLKASLDKRSLTISYTSDQKQEGEKTRKHSFSSFSRSWEVPEGTVADDINAEYKDGILAVTVKKPQLQTIPAQDISIV